MAVEFEDGDQADQYWDYVRGNISICRTTGNYCMYLGNLFKTTAAEENPKLEAARDNYFEMRANGCNFDPAEGAIVCAAQMAIAFTALDVQFGGRHEELLAETVVSILEDDQLDPRRLDDDNLATEGE